MAGDVDKGIYGSTVPVLDGEKLTVRILVSIHNFIYISSFKKLKF